MNLPNSFTYSRIERTDGGIRPIIKTLGATSPGMSISLISTIIPKNDTSRVNTKKNTIATRNPTVLAVVRRDSLATSATWFDRVCHYNMLMNLSSCCKRVEPAHSSIH